MAFGFCKQSCWEDSTGHISSCTLFLCSFVYGQHKAELDAVNDEVKALDTKIQLQVEEMEKLNLANQELTEQLQKVIHG